MPGAKGRTSVGTRVRLDHLAATAVGGTVHVGATLESQDGRLLRFAVQAHDGDDRLLATGEITRVLVDPERFLARIGPADPAPHPAPHPAPDPAH